MYWYNECETRSERASSLIKEELRGDDWDFHGLPTGNPDISDERVWTISLKPVWKGECIITLGPIVVGVGVTIAASSGVIIVVTVRIERAADIVDLALGSRDLDLIPRRAVLAGLHREHLHLLLEAELLRHRADLRVLLLLLLLRQSLLSRVSGKLEPPVGYRSRNGSNDWNGKAILTCTPLEHRLLRGWRR